jgi:hypothetical protein
MTQRDLGRNQTADKKQNMDIQDSQDNCGVVRTAFSKSFLILSIL